MGIEFAGHRPSWAVAIIASTAQYGPDGVAREPVARAIADALPLFVQDVHFHLTLLCKHRGRMFAIGSGGSIFNVRGGSILEVR
jgi:hypothetical protein